MSRIQILMMFIVQNTFSILFVFFGAAAKLDYSQGKLIFELSKKLSFKYISQIGILPIFYFINHHSIFILNCLLLYVYKYSNERQTHEDIKFNIFYNGFSAILGVYLIGCITWMILVTMIYILDINMKTEAVLLLKMNLNTLLPHGKSMVVGFLLSNICFMLFYIPISEYFKKRVKVVGNK